MVAQGDGYLSGGVHGDSFQAIAHYFQQRTCRSCEQPYAPEGIEFLRQEPGVIVVKVGCSSCGRPLGIALVGMNNMSHGCSEHKASGTAKTDSPSHPREWSKRDTERLRNKPPITYDDVLSAHEFFSTLGSNWSSFLPRSKKSKLKST
jgi:hypothetical protein